MQMLCNRTLVHQEADNTVTNNYLFSILQNSGILCSILKQIIIPRTTKGIQLCAANKEAADLFFDTKCT